MIKEVKKYYQYIYNSVYDTNVYMRYTDRQEQTIKNFLNDLGKKYTYDKEFLFQFMSFQFNERLNQKTGRRIQLNWVCGKTAIEYWEAKPDEYTWILRRFWKKYGITPPEIKKSLKRTYSTLYKEYSERERLRFDDERRLLHCMNMDLFENDSICKECKFYKTCYEIQNKIQ